LHFFLDNLRRREVESAATVVAQPTPPTARRRQQLTLLAAALGAGAGLAVGAVSTARVLVDAVLELACAAVIAKQELGLISTRSDEARACGETEEMQSGCNANRRQ